MFADITRFVDMTHHHMSMLDGDTAPKASCALPNTPLVPSNMVGGYFCPATLNGADVYRYVQGENDTFKQNFGPSENKKSAQYCANIPGVGVSCSDYVPCRNDFTTADLTSMNGNSCGCLGFKYCLNGVGSDTAPSTSTA
jgi:hypothetical protein